MKLLAEAFAYALIYTAFLVVLFRRQGAVRQLYNYPPRLQARAVELGITTEDEMRRNAVSNKLLGCVVLVVLDLLFVCGVNGVTGFWAGFWQSYLLLNFYSFWDAAVLDSLWFCHDKFWRIPGTEDLESEYRDSWFHWKWFFLGLLAQIPVCAVLGGLVCLLGLLR